MTTQRSTPDGVSVQAAQGRATVDVAEGVPRIRPVDPSVVPGDVRSVRERALSSLVGSIPVLLGVLAGLVANVLGLAWWWTLAIGAGLGLVVALGTSVVRRTCSARRAEH